MSGQTTPAPESRRPEARRYSPRLLAGAIVALALLGVLLIALDWREVQSVVAQADWGLIPWAVACAAVSYLCLSYSFALVNRIFGIRLGHRDLVEIGFISSVMIAAVGGVAGHSLRLLLMLRRGLTTGDAMAPSLFHGYFESLVFFAFIPGGFIYLLLTHPLPESVAIAVAVGAGVLGIAFGLTAVVFFVAPARAVALGLVRRVWKMVTRRDMEGAVRDFEATLAQGLAVVRQGPLGLALPLLLILADRLSRIGVVWFCFAALGGQAEPGVVVTGFAIGVALGVMSMVPGGLGVQEGSMAGAYHLLGVPLEEAVLVSLLFRVIYYMLPFGISLAFYWPVLRGVKPPGLPGHRPARQG